MEAPMQRLLALALKQANNNVAAAARSLGVTRDYVRYRLSAKNSRELPG
jgi:transcriptional regulator with GAF, ATPase, and Fis domain